MSLTNAADLLQRQAQQLNADAASSLIIMNEGVKAPNLQMEVQMLRIKKLVAELVLPQEPFSPRSIEEFNQKCRAIFRPFFHKSEQVFSELKNLNVKEIYSNRWNSNYLVSKSLTLVDFQTFRQKHKIIPQPLPTAAAEPNLSFTEYLNKNGLIGLPDDLDITLGPILARQGPFKDEVEKRGLKAEKGIILYGPPGTGKTSFARHLAKYLKCDEKNVNLIASTTLIQSQVGQTEENIRNLFKPSLNAQKLLKEKSPLFIVVLDEIESIASKRDLAKNRWESNAVNQLLTCLDGFEQQNNLLVIGLTNKIELLDEALLRTGRFGIQIEIGLPNRETRKAILNLYLKTLSENNYLDPSVQIDTLKDLTVNYSGAKLKGLVEQVNRLSFDRFAKAKREGKEEAACLAAGRISLDDFKQAIINIK